MRNPKFGDTHIERVCGTLLAQNSDGTEHICGKGAVIHVMWEDSDPFMPGFACDEHKALILSYRPFQHHSLGACCGMPGALWFVEENVCGYEDELPVAEPAWRLVEAK